MTLDLGTITSASYSDLMAFIYYLVNFAMSIAVLLCVVAVIIAGFKYIFSRGDEDKVKGATQTLLFALVGLILVFISPMIVRFVISTVLSLK